MNEIEHVQVHNGSTHQSLMFEYSLTNLINHTKKKKEKNKKTQGVTYLAIHPTFPSLLKTVSVFFQSPDHSQ